MRFVVRRILSACGVVLTLTFVTFLLARVVPSNPAAVYIGPRARPEQIARVRAQLGLDDPLLVQYLTYLRDTVTGDWGTSIGTKRPVLDEILSRLPATLELIAVAMTVAVLVGVALGVLAARHPGGLLDGTVRILSIGGVSMPAFWLGLLLQIVFVGKLGVLPATGRLDRTLEYTQPLREVTGFHLLDALLTLNAAALSSAASHLVLPALTLAAYPAGLMARMTRATMREALEQDYVLAARASGLREGFIVWRLALRNAIPPTLTVLGLTVAYALTGTFFVEVVFNWPGIGLFATQALLNVDYPSIMGITLLAAIGYLMVNLVVDVVHARLDPRVRLT